MGASFAYIAARVRVMKRKLLPRDTYPKLLNMELPEIARFLGETEYKSDIDALSGRFSGVELIEHALNHNLATTFTKLLKITEGEANFYIKEYLRRWDVSNIISILRGILTKTSFDEIIETIVPAGEFEYEFLLSLARKTNIAEVVAELENTIFYQYIKDTMTIEDLKETEDALYKMYYTRLTDLVEPSTQENVLFLKFLKTEIDLKNIITLLRMKHGNADPHYIISCLIPHGVMISPKKMEDMAYLSYKELFRSLETFPFLASIENLEDAPISRIENALESYMLKYASEISFYYPLSILPVMIYIYSKTVDVKNIRMIACAKDTHLPREIIEEMVV